MRQLFELIYRYRAFFTFILLEVICFWLITGTRIVHNAAIFNTSNNLIASIYSAKNGVFKYFNLVNVNEDLSNENAFLRELINKGKSSNLSSNTSIRQIDTLFVNPSDTIQQYEYIPARVINNSFRLTDNYITIDKGKLHGIKPEMGVISSGGIVGHVKVVSNKFSTIYSLLHSEVFVSSMIDRLGVFCTTKWQGNNPTKANLLYVPRHVNVQQGDSIVTSGYNAIFPPGLPIGIVEAISIDPNETFYDIELLLSNDFSRLSHVYLIKNKFKLEKDSLQSSYE